MAFKKFSQYTEEKNGVFFTLPNDGDFADVVFLYQSPDDAMIADVHYLSTPNYKGYAHCLEQGCPACSYPTKDGRGIRKDEKLFIPLYNHTKGKIEFWERGPRFMQQVLEPSVFRNYPNPSEYVFRITRHGAAFDTNTRYDVRALSRNTAYPFEKICADFGLSFPDSYSQVCKEMTVQEMSNALNTVGSGSGELGEYDFTPRPRVSAPLDNVPPAPDYTVSTPDYNPVPEAAPGSIPGVDLPEMDISPIGDTQPVPEPITGSEAPDDSSDSLDDVSF